MSAKQKPPPLKLRNLSTANVKNIKKYRSIFFEMPKPLLKLKYIQMLQFNRNNPFVKCRYSYRGNWQTSIVRNKNKLSEVLTLDCLYTELPHLAPAKLKDVTRVLFKFLVKT